MLTKKYLILTEADHAILLGVVEHMLQGNVDSSGRLMRPCRVSIECVEPTLSLTGSSYREGVHLIARKLAAGGMTVAERNRLLDKRTPEVRKQILELEKFYREAK